MPHRDGWRPIATAPRDGTEVMVRYPESVPMPGAPGGSMRFDAIRPARFDRSRGRWITTDAFGDRVTPVDWQPIPQPPAVR